MSEFVEERLDFVVGQQRGLFRGGLGKVANQRGDRFLHAAVAQDLTRLERPHRRMVEFVRPWMQVQVELPKFFPAGLVVHFKHLHVRVPEPPTAGHIHVREANAPFDVQVEVLADGSERVRQTDTAPLEPPESEVA